MALEIKDGSKHSGKFNIASEILDGELTFAGNETRLYVHSPSFFHFGSEKQRYVQGKLHDLTSVTLMECIAGGTGHTSWHNGEIYHFSEIEPQFVLHGKRHLSPKDELIQEVSFILSDATSIFQDYDSFAIAIAPTKEQIRDLAQDWAKISQRKIRIGSRPQIAFFTGRSRIFCVKTELGTIRADHCPRMNLGGPDGVYIKNQILTGIRFPHPVEFKTAIESLFPLLQFMQMIAGRSQEVSQVSLHLKDRDPNKRILNVYWCSPPKCTSKPYSSNNTHVTDLPIDAVRETKLFERVLKNYLDRHSNWETARWRFYEGFANERYYTIDRLIGSANMFDLLPSTSQPAPATLMPDILKASAASKALFSNLPPSPERDSILAALGRIKNPNLKRKIEYRAAPVIAALGKELPQLIEVLHLAVDARNYFVHGGTTKLDFAGALQPSLHFLTNALEFTFATSDLHEAGWPIGNLLKNGTGHSHPFGLFVSTYWRELYILKSALPSSHRLHIAPEDADTLTV